MLRVKWGWEPLQEKRPFTDLKITVENLEDFRKKWLLREG